MCEILQGAVHGLVVPSACILWEKRAVGMVEAGVMVVGGKVEIEMEVVLATLWVLQCARHVSCRG